MDFILGGKKEHRIGKHWIYCVRVVGSRKSEHHWFRIF